MEKVWHITVKSKTNEAGDLLAPDVDAAAEDFLDAKLSAQVEAAGCHAHVNRSFNVGSTPTIITFVAPQSQDPKKQITPSQFFADTNLIAFSATDVTPQAEMPPTDLPKGAKVVPAGQTVVGEAGQPETVDFHVAG